MSPTDQVPPQENGSHEQERRTAPRTPLRLPVTFQTATTIMQATLELANLSPTGAFLELAGDEQVGARCSITIHGATGEGASPLLLEGNINRVADSGVGIHFRELDPASAAALQQLLAAGDNQNT